EMCIRDSSMVPAIRRLYPENNEARKQAIRRHLEFFNTQPFVAAPILGVTLALEEQRANGAEIDDGAINGIKVGLMGPLAGCLLYTSDAADES
ncbi:PTS system mannose/fructose/sorbose family transporter subunit IID, partial [Escherichia sp. S69_ASV_4]|nr:PTS system mannose/fructose/sorbose family transporter subunit IID [Escherichia sp. S69_ASV_4]